jgi:hypothetical protein
VISLTIFQLFLVQDPPLIPIVNLLQTIDKWVKKISISSWSSNP